MFSVRRRPDLKSGILVTKPRHFSHCATWLFLQPPYMRILMWKISSVLWGFLLQDQHPQNVKNGPMNVLPSFNICTMSISLFMELSVSLSREALLIHGGGSVGWGTITSISYCSSLKALMMKMAILLPKRRVGGLF